MSSSAIRAGQAVIEIGADPRKFFDGLDRLRKHIRNVGVSVSNAGVSMIGLGAVATAPFAAALRQSSAFQDTMAAVAAVTDATGKDFEALKKKAMDLGATTSFTAQEVADGMQALGQGGFTVQETLGGIEGTLLLARAGMLDLGEATSITVAILRSFKMPTQEAGKVADILAKAANSSNANVQGLGLGLAIAGGMASTAGISLQELTASLGILADRGADASVAGTGMRRVLSALAGEQKKLKEMGVEVKDPQTGRLRPLIDILRDLNVAISALDETDKIAKLNDIFDTFGATAVIQLLGATDSLETLTATLNNSHGAAKKAADIMENTLGGSFRILSSAVEAVSLEIGDQLTPEVRSLADRLAKVASGIAIAVQRNAQFATGIAKAAAATVGAGVAMVALGSGVRIAAFGIGGLVMAAKAALSPITAVIAMTRAMATSMVAVTRSVWAAVAAVVAYGQTVIVVAAQQVAAAGASVAAWAAATAPILAAVAAMAAASVVIVGVVGHLGKIRDAAASAFASLGTGFSKVAEDGKRAFSDIYGIATITFGGIYDAIVAGEMSVAFDVLWAGLAAAWFRGQETVMAYVDYFVESIQNAFGDLQTRMIEALMGGTDTLGSIWESFTGGLYDIWTGGIDKIVEYWNWAVGPIKRTIDYIRSYFDGSMDYEEVANQARQANEAAKAGRAQRSQDRAAERQANRENANANLGTQRMKAGSAKEVAEMMVQAASAATADELRSIDERGRELQAEGNITKAQYERLSTAVDDRTLELDSARAMKAQEDAKAADAASKAVEAGAAVQGEQAKIDSAGTFSADAILGMGFSSSLAERTAKATEEIAKNTKKMAEAEVAT